MKELDQKDAPAVSGGQLPTTGDLVPGPIGPMPIDPTFPIVPGPYVPVVNKKPQDV